MSQCLQRVLVPIAVLILSAAAERAHGQYDLTGDWHISNLHGPGPDKTEWDATIVQEGAALTVGEWDGSIDPMTGRFVIVTYRHPRCDGPYGIHAELIDPNHFSGYLGGYIVFEDEQCHLVSVPVTGVRLDPIDLCAGDCDGNGRATVEEVVRLVRCLLAPIPAIEQPCNHICAADIDASGSISVNELVSVVNNVLYGCEL